MANFYRKVDLDVPEFVSDWIHGVLRADDEETVIDFGVAWIVACLTNAPRNVRRWLRKHRDVLAHFADGSDDYCSNDALPYEIQGHN